MLCCELRKSQNRNETQYSQQDTHHRQRPTTQTHFPQVLIHKIGGNTEIGNICIFTIYFFDEFSPISLLILSFFHLVSFYPLEYPVPTDFSIKPTTILIE